MKALILSGGGALGAFQVGAERYAREVKGYQWGLIAGISVGALNGAMMAMGKYPRLYEVWWKEMSNEVMYGPLYRLLGRVPVGLPRLRSLYLQRWIRRRVERELGQGEFEVSLRVGAVSLITGKYEIFDERRPRKEVVDAVLASAAMPVIVPPAKVGADIPWMIDGGVRNTSPVADVLKDNPDEIVIINCLPTEPGPLAKHPCTLVGIATRSFDVMVNEIFLEDIKEFVWINTLVDEAKRSNVVLHHPDDGRPLRYVPYKLIQPVFPLGDAQDYSQEQAVRLLSEGRRRAEEVLG